jgi:hypothetical protein
MDPEIWGTNSCMNVNLSPFHVKDGKIYMPWYYLEDYFEDYFEENNLTYGKDKENLWVFQKDIDIDTLYELRAESYSAENWYETLKDYTYESIIVPDDGYLNVEKLKDEIERSSIDFGKIKRYFVRSEAASPKDIHSTCIVDDLSQALKIYRESERIAVKSTASPCIMLRKVDDTIHEKIELRCFVYHGRVRSISQNCNREPFTITKEWIDKTVRENCKKWNSIVFPFTDCTFDVAVDSNGGSVIIEVNSFGGDSYAGSALFSWSEDYYMICHTEDRVVMRFKDFGTMIINP